MVLSLVLAENVFITEETEKYRKNGNLCDQWNQ